MKKTLFFAMAAIIAAGSITSCKKGENDPGLSLKSRKGRISGTWKLVEGSITYADPSNSTSSTTTYTETSVTTVSSFSFGGTTITSTEVDNINDFSITIEKTGSYTMNMSTTQSTVDGNAVSNPTTSVENTSGNWAFVGKSKDADLKNKEAIAFNQTSETNTFTTGGTSNSSTVGWSGITNMDVWMIDQLKNKEVIFKGTYTYTNSNNETETSTYELKFAKQ